MFFLYLNSILINLPLLMITLVDKSVKFFNQKIPSKLAKLCI